MRAQDIPQSEAMVVPTVPARIPMLHADSLPGDEDWAVLNSLGLDDGAFDNDLQDDRYGSLMLAPGAFD